MLADNDNPAPAGEVESDESVPPVSLLSFY